MLENAFKLDGIKMARGLLFAILLIVGSLGNAKDTSVKSLNDRLMIKANSAALITQMSKSPLEKEFRDYLLSQMRDSGDKKYYGKQFANWKLTERQKLVSVSDEIQLVDGDRTILRMTAAGGEGKGVIINGKQFTWNPARPLRGELEKFFNSGKSRKKSAMHGVLDMILPTAAAELQIPASMFPTIETGAAMFVVRNNDQSMLKFGNEALPEILKASTQTVLPPSHWYRRTKFQCNSSLGTASGSAYLGSDGTPIKFTSSLDGSVILTYEKDGKPTTYRLSQSDSYKNALYDAKLCDDARQNCYEKDSSARMVCAMDVSESPTCRPPMFNFNLETCSDPNCARATKIQYPYGIADNFSKAAREASKADNSIRLAASFPETAHGLSFECMKRRPPNGIPDCYFKGNGQISTPEQDQFWSEVKETTYAYRHALEQESGLLNEAFDILGSIPGCCNDPSGTCPKRMWDDFGIILKGAKAPPPALSPSTNAPGAVPGGRND